MLPALCVSTGNGFQRRIAASRTAKTSVYRRIVFQDLRDDWLAGGLFAGEPGVDKRDVEGAGTLDQQCHFDLASRGGRGVQWSARFRGRDARRIFQATGMV